ncbi:MAG: hypothetical protein K2K74_14985, partial [Lachnospiraceae bacterium]|nr:hypothetical protein [Lachnospiraceae bacterium]
RTGAFGDSAVEIAGHTDSNIESMKSDLRKEHMDLWSMCSFFAKILTQCNTAALYYCVAAGMIGNCRIVSVVMF